MPTITQDDLNDAIWRACDTFRGAVDATRYKDLILAVLFWKYLTDHTAAKAKELVARYGEGDPRIASNLKRLRFRVPEGSDFWSVYAERQAENVGERINIALDKIERENEPKLTGLFRPIDFNSETLLGATRERNRLLRLLLEDFAKPELVLSPERLGPHAEDLIGEAYIYLISKFAADAGKKAGEFYTPRSVADLVARLAAPKPGDKICDPSCGSGSLLIRAAEAVGDRDHLLFGQEVNGSTAALARMNMFLHDEDDARIEWCNTLTAPALVENDRLMQFDVVVANPPFSLDKWGADEAAADPWRRFTPVVPPKGRGDYAFILHMLAIAKRQAGRVVCVAPHGVLFRSGAEGRIRQSLIEKNLLDGVVGLPAQLFPSTGIPVCLMIFDRAREEGGPRADVRDVMFVDASRDFTPGKRQNQLEESHVACILEAYAAREKVDRYAHVAPLSEIEQNGYNLNIHRYVDTFEPEPEIDLQAVQAEIEEVEAELQRLRGTMDGYLKALGVDVRGVR